MDGTELATRLLAHRHLLQLLLSERKDIAEVVNFLQQNAEVSETRIGKAESTASYRDELDRIGSSALLLQRSRS